MNSEQSNDDTWQLLTMVPDLVDTSTSKSVRPPRTSWYRISQVFSPLPARRPGISETQHAKPVPHSVGGHTFVDATFRKRAFAPSSHRVAADHRDRGLSSRHLSGVHEIHEKGRSLVLPLLHCSPLEVHGSRARGVQHLTEVPRVNPVCNIIHVPNIIVTVSHLLTLHQTMSGAACPVASQPLRLILSAGHLPVVWLKSIRYPKVWLSRGRLQSAATTGATSRR
jgi:hypothetical protein